MSERSSGLQKEPISRPVLFGLGVTLMSLLYLIANANWFSMGSPIGVIFQRLIEVLFFFTIFIAPVLLAWKTKWPVWFIGLGCGVVSTILVQTGIHGGPENAEAVGSLLSVSFVIQSLISTGIALVTNFVLKRFSVKPVA